MNNQDNEIPDQAAFLSCIWDVLPDGWKEKLKTPDAPPKIMIMMPGGGGFDIEYITPRAEYYMPHDYSTPKDRHPITFEKLDWE